MALDSIAGIERRLRESGGVPVTLHGGSWHGPGLPTYGHIERTAVELDGNRGLGIRIVVTVATGSLPGLELDKMIDVNGTIYRALDVAPIEDGALTQVLLGELAG